MLYLHHGMGTGFSGGYHEYFSEATDIVYINY
jgi:1,4-alpha-glucan branching enzyme